MTNRTLYLIWAVLFALCAALGFIPEPTGILGGIMTALSLAFFIPPFLLIFQARKSGKTAPIRLIRSLSVFSLSLTLILLIANFLTAMSSEFLGAVMHYVLIIVSTPMITSGYWALSLFLWSCLLMLTIRTKK